MKYTQKLLTGAAIFIACMGVVLVLPTPELVSSAATLAGVSENLWANPTTTTVKRISDTSPHQNEPIYLSNLDCILQTYRLAGSQQMQTGCFTPTAYGQIDSDSDNVLFNGTDEAVHIYSYSPHQVLSPWPRAMDLVALDAQNSGGVAVSLYKNPLMNMNDTHDILGLINGKQITAPPELPLKNSDGKPLIVNGQSIAFSEGGSWMIAEVLGGSFVRINLATLQQKPFAVPYSRAGSTALDSSSVTVSRDGRYVAIENTYAAEFKVYDLNNCTADRCASYNYWPLISKQIPSLMHISHVRFLNQGLISFDASSRSSSAGGSYLLAPRASITSLIDYLGMGDSYSSGEGAFDYLIGTDTTDNRCHLSSHSYPILLTSDLFSGTGGHSVACSGAVIHDIGNTSDNYRGQMRGVADWAHLNADSPQLLSSVMTNYLPGYVSQQRFVEQYQPANATLTISGNDVGFGDIIARCALPRISAHTNVNVCFSTYEDRQELLGTIKRTGDQLKALYSQLRRTSPVTKFYALGYPHIVIDNGNCGLNVHFNTSELEFIHELVVRLNDTISSAANANGMSYVDISEALAGHRLCESNSAAIAVNGLTAGTDIGVGFVKVIGKESYHPNALGHQLIEQAILQKTHHFTLVITGTMGQQPKPSFTAAPATGRTIYQVAPSTSLAPPAAVSGQSIAITIDRVAQGFAPGSNLQIRLNGAGNTPVAQIVGGSQSTTITALAPTVPGVTTIHVTGPGQTGQPIDVVQVIIIGQGNPSACPVVDPSGIDADHDGIDDACDPVIGPATPPPTAPSIIPVAPAPTPVSSPLVVNPANSGALPSPSANTPSYPLQPAAQQIQMAQIALQPVAYTTIPELSRLPLFARLGTSSPLQQNSNDALAQTKIAQTKKISTKLPVLPRIPWQLWLSAALVWVITLLGAHRIIGRYSAKNEPGSRST